MASKNYSPIILLFNNQAPNIHGIIIDKVDTVSMQSRQRVVCVVASQVSCGRRAANKVVNRTKVVQEESGSVRKLRNTQFLWARERTSRGVEKGWAVWSAENARVEMKGANVTHPDSVKENNGCLYINRAWWRW